MAVQMGVSTIAATIAASGTLSPEVDLGAGVLVGLFVPAAWTAANITFQGSPLDGTTFGNVYTYLGAELTFVAGAGQFLTVDPTQLRGLKALKVRSGTSGTPVAQASQVTLTLLVVNL